jgi:hypothetical protein
MGQRDAAKATQEKFKLKTFSHSTVCRSFKTLEHMQKKALERRFGKEFQPHGNIGHTTNIKPVIMCAEIHSAPHTIRRFPSVKDTAERRAEIAVFLQTFHNAVKESKLESSAKLFVKHTFGNTIRLLL